MLRGDRDTRYSTRLFAESIPRGGAVVHGGAHLGHHVLIAAAAVGPRGSVTAFEPNPASYRALRSNVRRNGYGDRVKALPMRIGALSSVGTLSLDGTIGGRAIDVIKLTVDGEEVEALRGMRRTLELSPTARLFVECDPRALVRAGTGMAELLDELHGLEMRVQVVDDARDRLIPVGSWLAAGSGPAHLLCEPATVTRRIARRVRTARRERVPVPA
jgi:hypothetical protein